MYISKRFFGLAIVSLAVFGCAWGGSPHENFKNIMQSQIGKSIDNAPEYSFRHAKDMVESKVLPNGNIENKYYFQKTCYYYFEIDPKTRLIVAVRYEGSETDCYVNP